MKNGTSLSLPLGVSCALALVLASSPAAAQFDDFLDFGSTTGKLNDVDGSIANVTAFNGNPYTISYSPDSIDFGGTLVTGDNSGVFLSLDPLSSVSLSGVQEDSQRLQVDVTIGAANEAENVTVQLADSVFGTGYAYQFDISGLSPGQHTLFGPVLDTGVPVGGFPLDYNQDVIDQVTFFSGNFVSGVSQTADFSVDSLSLFTPVPVDPGKIEFGPVLNQLSFGNGGLSGVIDGRGAQFDGETFIPTPDPVDTPDGLRFTGTVQARSLNGHGVELTEGVDIDPAANPLNGSDELVLEIVVGEGNEVRDIIFEILSTTGPGQGDLAQKSWFISGIQDLAPGTHILTPATFDEGTNNQGVFAFDPDEGDLVNKIVLFGFNAENDAEPTAEEVTDKELDITIKRVSFGLDTIGNLPGDFNGDLVVNIADYTVWRDNFGAPEGALGGNGDNSGTVDQGDYDVWVNNFGAAASSSAAIPEPTSVAAVLLAMAAVSLRRRIG